MRRLKKIGIVMAAALALSGFSACGASGDTETAVNTESSADTDDMTGNSSDDVAASNQTVAAVSSVSANRETIYQVSLLQGLTLGDYYGSVPAGELKRYGDTGLGTFDGLNGELIMLGGEVYRAAGDGSVEAVADDELIPFSDVSFFDVDEAETVEAGTDFSSLTESMNAKIAELGENRFYVIRLDGTFEVVNARSEYAQEEPYKPLAEVLETDQTFFDYENVKGTVVGLYCPEYMNDLNATGWHLHFISEDRTKGGHVLGLTVDAATLSWDYTDGFQMILPETEMFAGLDLTVDQSEDIEKVEKNVDSSDKDSDVSTATDSEEAEDGSGEASDKASDSSDEKSDKVTDKTSDNTVDNKSEGSSKSSNSEMEVRVLDNGRKISSDSRDFVVITDVVPDAILEIRYYSTYNFVGERLDGYEEPTALLTREAAEALKEVSDELKSQGYLLKIYDAYRPQTAVSHMVRWAADIDDTRMKEYFYPDLDKSVLFNQGYITEYSGHSRGSSVDLTLFDMRTEKDVDMGGTFDWFGSESHPDYTGITDEQYANRMLLRNAMMNHGFKPINSEWWHFNYINEPYTDIYFDFPVSRESVDAYEED